MLTAVLLVGHRDLVAPFLDVDCLGIGQRPFAKQVRQHFAEPAGAAQHIDSQRITLAGPDHAEQGDANAGAEILGLGGGTLPGGPEQRLDALWKWPEEVTERLIGHVAGDTGAAMMGRFSLPRLHLLLPALHRLADLEAHPCHGYPFLGCQWQCQRQCSDGIWRMNLAAMPDGKLVAGDWDDVEPHRNHQVAHVRPGSWEQMSSEIEPVVTALFGIKPSAEAVRLLKQQQAAIPQFPGRRQSSRSAADDDDVVFAVAHGASRWR